MTLRVDWRASASLVGSVLKYLALTLTIPVIVALRYGESTVPFLVTAAVAVTVGLALERLEPDPEIGNREGFLVVAAIWIAVSFVGAIPYLIAGWGSASTLATPVNAMFESTSGFTTTGATVMGKISTARHSRALLMWRQETQWLGGMGIVVLAVAILPKLSVGGAQLMDAEAPGPGIEKLTPRIAETARALWKVYAGITLFEMALLYGLHLAGMAPGMTLFNAVAHGFTTMATGGFSPEARSIEAFTAVVQWVVIPFMMAAGTNFALFWHVLDGNFRKPFFDPEFRFYVGILGTLSAIGAGVLFVDGGLANASTASTASYYASVGSDVLRHTFPIAGDLGAALRHAIFQIVSIVTTTGYASMDFNAWSGPARYLLVIGMFIGGSAGSTGGGLKIVRWLVILKSIRRELFTTVHPEAVRPIRLAGRPLDDRAIKGIYVFTLLYFVLFLLGTFLLAIDGAVGGTGLTVLEAMTACAATLGNIGPGLGGVGPMSNYLGFDPGSKIVMIALMWIGRLEILPVLVLFTRGFWQS
ncbi:MAG: trk system potassium uptake protein TrkH [Halobacteriales archaeon]|jgi:trk system potassium uptake protein TrkH